uniref:Leucine rich repeat containing 74A n=1 Tax=Scleropages formosus TaxID=113540 RepID=A0A8C9WCQ5_SCLFO
STQRKPTHTHTHRENMQTPHRLSGDQTHFLSHHPGAVRHPHNPLSSGSFISEEAESNPHLSQTELYLQACRALGVVPVSYYLRHLGASTLNLNHHGLGPLGAKALATALTDVRIAALELEDNFLLSEGTRYIVEMLNLFLCPMQNLSSNHLRAAGAECVAKMLPDNVSLRSIRLSGSIRRHAPTHRECSPNNHRVKELDLSHNRFCGRGGEYLSQMLANNEGLETVDLSWNHLRMKGAVALSAGLKVNITLKHLDLSWNGFGNEGALALGEALKYNDTLVHLDLSHNRVTNEGARTLCRGLEINDTLRVLRVSVPAPSSVRKFHLEEQCVTLYACSPIVMTDDSCKRDIVSLAKRTLPPQDYLDERKLRLWDFFRNIDKDGTMRVPVSDFRKAVQVCATPAGTVTVICPCDLVMIFQCSATIECSR